jgi:hypothetical protein
MHAKQDLQFNMPVKNIIQKSYIHVTTNCNKFNPKYSIRVPDIYIYKSRRGLKPKKHVSI